MENRYFTRFTRSLAQSDVGISALKYVLGGKTLPSDDPITEAYHSCLGHLAEAFLSELGFISEPSDRRLAAIEFLSFADRNRPYSPRAAGNRPSHYWEAASQWAEAVLAAARVLPRACRNEDLLRQARFVRAYLDHVEIPIQVDWDAELTFMKPGGNARWYVRTEQGGFSRPLAWGVLSGRDVEARAVRYQDADGIEILAVLATRGGQFPEVAAACERRGSVWSGWRVASGREAVDLKHFAMLVPQRNEVRVGDQFIQVAAVYPLPHPWRPPEDQIPAVVPGRLRFDPPPVSSSDRGDWTVLRFAEGVETVVVFHPDHGRYELTLANADSIGVRQIPGWTYQTGYGSD